MVMICVCVCVCARACMRACMHAWKCVFVSVWYLMCADVFVELGRRELPKHLRDVYYMLHRASGPEPRRKAGVPETSKENQP